MFEHFAHQRGLKGLVFQQETPVTWIDFQCMNSIMMYF